MKTHAAVCASSWAAGSTTWFCRTSMPACHNESGNLMTDLNVNECKELKRMFVVVTAVFDWQLMHALFQQNIHQLLS